MKIYKLISACNYEGINFIKLFATQEAAIKLLKEEALKDKSYLEYCLKSEEEFYILNTEKKEIEDSLENIEKVLQGDAIEYKNIYNRQITGIYEEILTE